MNEFSIWDLNSYDLKELKEIFKHMRGLSDITGYFPQSELNEIEAEIEKRELKKQEQSE
jgi:hypothetical protein